MATACAGQGAAGRAPSDRWSQHPHGAPGTTAGSPCAQSPPQTPTRCLPGPGVPSRAVTTHPRGLRPLLGTHSLCRLFTRAARIGSHPGRAAVRVEAFQEKGPWRDPPPQTLRGLQDSPTAPGGSRVPAHHSLSSPASPAQECRWIKIPTASVIRPARLWGSGLPGSGLTVTAGPQGSWASWAGHHVTPPPAPTLAGCGLCIETASSGPAHPLGPFNAQGH